MTGETAPPSPRRPAGAAPLLIAAGMAVLLEPDRARAGEPGDFWLAAFGLERWEWEIDHDGDAYTARQEYASGTDPFDAGFGFGFAPPLAEGTRSFMTCPKT